MNELSGARVLVVDDEKDTRDIVEMLILAHGAETRSASCAADGLAGIRTFRPNALVSDLAMPGEDGYAFIRKVRALPTSQGGSVPAIALSAHVYSDHLDRALASGFDAFLPKPVRPRALLDYLRALLARARAFVDRRRGERRRRGAAAGPHDRRRCERRQLLAC